MSERKTIPQRHPLIIEHNRDWLVTLQGMVEDGTLRLPFSYESVTSFKEAEDLLKKNAKQFTDLIAMPYLSGPDADWQSTIAFAHKFNLPITILTGSDNLIYQLAKQGIRAIGKNIWDSGSQDFKAFVADPRVM